MRNAWKAALFLLVFGFCCWVLPWSAAPAQTLPAPCSGEGDAWRCFDVAPHEVAEALNTLEFECYDMAGAKVVLLQLEDGEATRYRILARQIDGCKPGG